MNPYPKLLYYLKYPIFNNNKINRCKEIGMYDLYTRKKIKQEKKNQASETVFERAQMSDLAKPSKQLL